MMSNDMQFFYFITLRNGEVEKLRARTKFTSVSNCIDVGGGMDADVCDSASVVLLLVWEILLVWDLLLVWVLLLVRELLLVWELLLVLVQLFDD